jgi:histidine ammonia-lyase
MTKLKRTHVSLLPEQMRQDLGMVGMAQIGFVEEARRAAQRTFIPAAEGDTQNDVAEPVFLAYKKSLVAAECLDTVLAMLTVVASQAYAATEREAPPKLRGFLTAARTHCPPLSREGRRRSPGREIAKLRDAFSQAALTGNVDLV